MIFDIAFRVQMRYTRAPREGMSVAGVLRVIFPSDGTGSLRVSLPCELYMSRMSQFASLWLAWMHAPHSCPASSTAPAPAIAMHIVDALKLVLLPRTIC